MKKVSYVVGALGALPGLGMMTPQAATPAAHVQPKTAKSVSLEHSGMAERRSCTGHIKLSSPPSGHPRVTTWVAKLGTKECVGTIVGDARLGAQSVAVWVYRAGTRYCAFGKPLSSHISVGCHTSFTPPFLVVVSSRSATGTHHRASIHISHTIR